MKLISNDRTCHKVSSTSYNETYKISWDEIIPILILIKTTFFFFFSLLKSGDYENDRV
jgi:hypothetical protein